MINFNGNIVSKSENQLYNNRAFLFGDAVFETLKVTNNKILFLEDHYFRLMSSMRIMRMEIPMNFTMEFMEEQILLLIPNTSKNFRVRLTVYRDSDGLYLPLQKNIGYIITASEIDNPLYICSNQNYEVDLFKDFYITKDLLSTIKTTNRSINTLASIYASENDLQNCLLINDDKNVVEAINGNLFMLTGNKLITPPITEGCIAGILRKQLFTICNKIEGIELIEQTISPFDLQKADELFITNVITGLQSITKYRKKEYSNKIALEITKKLNAHLLIN